MRIFLCRKRSRLYAGDILEFRLSQLFAQNLDKQRLERRLRGIHA